jgi:hypothetical protein
MGDPIKNYGFGVDGVNLVSDPLKLKDSEATQLQNAELLDDEATGGRSALKQRGGFAALNGSAMSGSVLGGTGWPLRTTYTRTLYAARLTEDSNTWRTSTNGTSWTDTATPAAAAALAKYADENNARDARRMAAFRTYLLYPGNGYTQDTDPPIVVLWDGTASVTVCALPAPGAISNSSAAPIFAIVDMLVAEGTLYIATHEPGGSSTHNCGQVLSLDLDSGVLRQVATAFSGTSPEVDGGAPSCLAFYKGQLFVGLNGEATTDGIGKIVRCFPDVDTTWTTDVSNLSGHISSLAVFKGKLYAGTQSSAASAEKIYERSPTAGTWSAVFTGVGAGANAQCASLFVHSDSLYAVQYHETAPTIHIKVSTDGSSWSTSRDCDASDGAVAGNTPGQMATLSSKLYIVFRATAAGNADGFIMQLSSGTWTKVDTDNYGGPIAVLVQRSA